MLPCYPVRRLVYRTDNEWEFLNGMMSRRVTFSDMSWCINVTDQLEISGSTVGTGDDLRKSHAQEFNLNTTLWLIVFFYFKHEFSIFFLCLIPEIAEEIIISQTPVSDCSGLWFHADEFLGCWMSVRNTERISRTREPVSWSWRQTVCKSWGHPCETEAVAGNGGQRRSCFWKTSNREGSIAEPIACYIRRLRIWFKRLQSRLNLLTVLYKSSYLQYFLAVWHLSFQELVYK